MRKLTDKEIKKNLANVKASLAVEGLIVTDEEMEIGRKYLRGDLSVDEAKKILLAK